MDSRKAVARGELLYVRHANLTRGELAWNI